MANSAKAIQAEIVRQRTQELRDLLAKARGFTLAEGWCWRECLDCPCWFDSEGQQVTPQYLFIPEKDWAILSEFRSDAPFSICREGDTIIVTDGAHTGQAGVLEHAYLLYLIEKEKAENAPKDSV